MPKKNKLYQCPYELQCKCDLSEPCLGCETWAKHYGEFEINKYHTQPILAVLMDMRDYFEHDTCARGMRIYNRINTLLEQLQAND